MQRIRPGYAAETTPVARATWPCVQHDPPHARQNPFREKLGFVCKGFNLAMLQRQHPSREQPGLACNTTHLTKDKTHFARNLALYAKDSTWLCCRDNTVARATRPTSRKTEPISLETWFVMQRIQPGYATETRPVARATRPCVQHDPSHNTRHTPGARALRMLDVTKKETQSRVHLMYSYCLSLFVCICLQIFRPRARHHVHALWVSATANRL
jgi:hypothetical protein